MKKLGLVVALLLTLLAAVPTGDPDIRWYVNRPHAEGPVELEDVPAVMPVFEIRTGWLCDAGYVAREDDGRESRTVSCEKGEDRLTFSLACGPDRASDSHRLHFADITEPREFAKRDALTVGCIAQ